MGYKHAQTGSAEAATRADSGTQAFTSEIRTLAFGRGIQTTEETEAFRGRGATQEGVGAISTASDFRHDLAIGGLEVQRQAMAFLPTT